MGADGWVVMGYRIVHQARFIAPGSLRIHSGGLVRHVTRSGEGFAIEEAPVPALLEDGVLVRVRRSLVSDELGAALGPARPLWAVGEACSGTVVAAGRAGDLPPLGARVVCAGAGVASHAEY